MIKLLTPLFKLIVKANTDLRYVTLGLIGTAVAGAYALIILAYLGIFGGFDFSFASMLGESSEAVRNFNAIKREFSISDNVPVAIEGWNTEEDLKLNGINSTDDLISKDFISVGKYNNQNAKYRDKLNFWFRDIYQKLNEQLYTILKDERSLIIDELKEKEIDVTEKAIEEAKLITNIMNNFSTSYRKGEIKAEDLTPAWLNDRTFQTYHSEEATADVVEWRMNTINLSSDKDLMDFLNNAMPFMTRLYKMRDRFFDTYHYKNLYITFGGLPALAMEQGTDAIIQTGITFLIGVILILFVFYLGFRRLSFPFITLIPLFVGIIIMIGLLILIYGKFTSTMALVPLLLFGLGIDYCIHFGNRFSEVRREYGDEPDYKGILQKVYDSVGSGMLTGGVTTAAAFLIILVSKMDGLKQFGVAAAIGVGTAFFSVLLILPIIIVMFDKRRTKKGKGVTLAYRPMDRLGHTLQKPIFGPINLLVLLITIGLAVMIPQIKPDKDIFSGAVKNNSYSLLNNRMLSVFQNSSDQSILWIQAKKDSSFDERMALLDELHDYIESDEINTIDVDRIADFSMAYSLVKPFKGESYEEWLAYKPIFEATSSFSFGGVSTEVISSFLDYAYRNMMGKHHSFMVMLSPNGYVYGDKFFEKHNEDLKKIAVKFDATTGGLVPMIDEMKSGMFQDLGLSCILAILIVTLILFLDIRNPKAVILMITPVLVALVWTLGIMGIGSLLGAGIFYLSINNIMVFPLIIGIGIDDGVHLFHRFKHEGYRNINLVLSSTGKAVIMTTLTTVIGLGTFIVGQPKQQTVGALSVIGLLSALIITLVCEPYLFKLFYKDKLK